MTISRYFRVAILGVLVTASHLEAQNFDLAALKPPPGFLDLADLTIITDAYGVMTATATTRLGNAEARVMISGRLPIAGGERSFILAIKPSRWSITEAIPALSNPLLDNLTFENIALVISDQDIERHSSLLEEAEYEF